MSYIEREALREELRHCCIVAFDERSGEPYVIDIPQLLRRTTVSADVAPVVHGEWREDTDPADGDLRCTHCGIAWPKCVQKQIEEQGIWTLQTLFKYCPNCGAKMDKEAENERND